MKNQNPIARLKNIVVQDLIDETLVYDLNTNKAYHLNSTSAFVWSTCTGKNSVLEIERLIEKKFGEKVGAEFIWLTIDLLKKNDLLENADEVISNFDVPTRRQLLKKAGAASIVALPFISSLIAPKAAAAASGPVAGVCGAGGPPCSNVGNPCTLTGYCIPAGGGNTFFCSVGGVCLGYGTCYGTGTCVAA